MHVTAPHTLHIHALDPPFDFSSDQTWDIEHDLLTIRAAHGPHYHTPLTTAMEAELASRTARIFAQQRSLHHQGVVSYQNSPDADTAAHNSCDVPDHAGHQPDDLFVAGVNQMDDEYSGLDSY